MARSGAGAADAPGGRPRRALGLRWRIVAALVFVSAVTLGVAALALLSPLEHRLRNNELAGVYNTTVFTITEFQNLPATALKPKSGPLNRAVAALERRTGGQVSVLDSSYHPVIAAGPGPADPFGDGRRAIDRQRSVRGLASVDGTEYAHVAVPVLIGRRFGKYYAVTVRKPLQEVRGAVQVFRRAFETAGLAGLGLAVLLGVAIATRLVARLRRLRTAALDVAARGPTADAEFVADDATGDEVGDLARAFGTMQRRLRQQEEARRAFVATASHELRTPITSLRGMLELLEEDLVTSEPDIPDARTQVRRARSQTHRLGRLAADLLDLSRLDAEVELRSEPVELGELCRAVMAEFEFGAGERGIELELTGVDDPCWALADPGSVARILRILLENALRVAPEKEPVTIALTNGSGPVAVTVEDGGPGVPLDEREVIFQRFRRGSSTGGSAGFGLGLAIGRELAERMGGGLVLTSANGHGAAFRLELPAAPAP